MMHYEPIIPIPNQAVSSIPAKPTRPTSIEVELVVEENNLITGEIHDRTITMKVSLPKSWTATSPSATLKSFNVRLIHPIQQQQSSSSSAGGGGDEQQPQQTNQHRHQLRNPQQHRCCNRRRHHRHHKHESNTASFPVSVPSPSYVSSSPSPSYVSSSQSSSQFPLPRCQHHQDQVQQKPQRFCDLSKQATMFHSKVPASSSSSQFPLPRCHHQDQMQQKPQRFYDHPKQATMFHPEVPASSSSLTSTSDDYDHNRNKKNIIIDGTHSRSKYSNINLAPTTTAPFVLLPSSLPTSILDDIDAVSSLLSLSSSEEVAAPAATAGAPPTPTLMSKKKRNYAVMPPDTLPCFSSLLSSSSLLVSTNNKRSRRY